MAAYLPHGWPDDVRPPGSEEFEESAVAWLLDVLPPDYRRHLVLRRHPAALASVVRYSLRFSRSHRTPLLFRPGGRR
jgi:hypothetical protein